MPVCNCDQHRATHRFAGPGKTVYAFTLTNGCDNCGVGVYAQIHRFTREEAERAGILGLPEVPLRDIHADYGGRQAEFHVWDPLRLAAALEERLSEMFATLTEGKGTKAAERILEAIPSRAEIREILETHAKVVRNGR